ncbi:hypothetical protein [Microbacterium paulum]
MPHTALTPVFVGLRAGLHMLFVALTVLVIVRAVIAPTKREHRRHLPRGDAAGHLDVRGNAHPLRRFAVAGRRRRAAGGLSRFVVDRFACGWTARRPIPSSRCSSSTCISWAGCGD